MSRPPLTDLERVMGATEGDAVLTLTCRDCGADMVVPVFGGPLPFVVCERAWEGDCDSRPDAWPAALVMAEAGAPMLPGMEL
jgi:hypothetical protein